ncbi:MAG: hypothetical protein DRI88_09020 [Bacteroidetes bacterium]|nr:MAG: hypothetical protein DRI88_09020 [Bacteroidota bacterium]
MKRHTAFLIIILSVLLFSTVSCNKDSINPNLPNVTIRITINPNSTQFLELNTVGGWVYLDEKPSVYIPPQSRGVLVWRSDMTHFKAYERQPPNDPFKCCNENYSLCGKLVIGDNYPFVKDTCTGNMYQLLDGSLFQGEGRYPLIEYAAEYDGTLLYIHN